MANCLPFNSIEHDRVYKAEDWAWYFATFIANGVFPKPSDGLQVIAYNGMEIKVNAGYAFINGYAFKNPAGRSIMLDMAEGALNRIDRVVVRWDLPKRDLYLAVLKGTPSAKPQATALTRTTEIWELALADVYISKGVTKIQTKDITDQRFNSSLCGIVKGTIEEIDASTITKQFNDYVSEYKGTKTQEFEEWLKDMKDIVEDVENGNMLLQVKEMLDAMYQDMTDADIDDIIAGTYKDTDESGGFFESVTDDDIDAMINGTYIEIDEPVGDDVTDKEIQELIDSFF